MQILGRRRFVLTFAMLALLPRGALAQDAAAILRAAFDNWKADSSHAVMQMQIRRASGTRTMEMESWTKGRNKALVRFTKPARDAGNATLQDGRRTWVYNPKLNQVIQLPQSAMSQSWMGSDFSYNDLGKSDQLVTDYDSKVIATERAGGHTVYVIEAIPKRGKPIVWGKQIVRVRDDGVLLAEEFYDQRGNLVRKMTVDKVTQLGGRPYPAVITMKSVDKPGEWTRVTTKSATFNQPLPDYLFTRSNLQNPRD